MATDKNSNERSSFLANLPRQTFQIFDLYQWQGFWLMPHMLEAVMPTTRIQFEFLPDDIILASVPKTGTTWLKALVFSIINQELAADDPLLTHNPHQLVPFLEYQTLTDSSPEQIEIPLPVVFATQKRRVFATHLPYQLLPEPVKNSGCQIVYITRNPRDTFISGWQFVNTLRGEHHQMEEEFDSFCRGVSVAGPFFDHVLGYWKERDKHVHFVTYEELKENPREQVKKLAEFLGYPWVNSIEEVDEIVRRCSYERLSNLEINKNSELVYKYGWRNRSFFRRGVVGDWRNYLTGEMIERLDSVSREMLEGSGLHFQVSIKNDGEG